MIFEQAGNDTDNDKDNGYSLFRFDHWSLVRSFGRFAFPRTERQRRHCIEERGFVPRALRDSREISRGTSPAMDPLLFIIERERASVEGENVERTLSPLAVSEVILNRSLAWIARLSRSRRDALRR